MAIKLKNKLLYFFTAVIIAVAIVLTSQSFFYLSYSFNDTWETLPYIYSLRDVYLLDYMKKFDEDTLNTNFITDEQVYEYRYRFGSLEQQVQDVTEQYRQPLKEAEKSKDKKEVEKLTAERDSKIDALVLNFTDAEAVKEKILAENTKKMMAQKKDSIAIHESNVATVGDQYNYYLTDDQGRVYKNINNVASEMSVVKIKKELEEQGSGVAISVAIDINSSEVVDTPNQNIVLTGLKGYVTVKPDSDAEAQVEATQRERRNWQLAFISGILLLFVALYLFIRYLNTDFINPKFGKALQKVPVDLRLLLLLTFPMIGLLVTIAGTYGPRIVSFIIFFAIISLSVYLPFVKDIWFSLSSKNNYPALREQFKDSFCWMIVDRLVSWIEKSPLLIRLVSYFILSGLVILSGSWFLIISYNHLSSFISLFFFLVYLLIIGLFVINLVLRNQQAQKLLARPGEILSAFHREKMVATNNQEITEYFNEIERIVLNSQAHLLRNEELKTELLTNVSHDLRTPLTSIVTYGDLLTQPNLSEQERHDYTKIINQKALRMKHLIEDLFEVTKMNNGEIILNKEEVNMGQLLQQSVAEFSDEFATRDLKLLYTKPQEPVLLAVDGDKMWRVVDNLIGNILKYGLPSTRVYLKLLETPDEVQIELKNVSRHELNEDAEKLVERFSRGDEARNTEGSGLGLAIAHSIVTLHGGDMDIQVDGDLFKVQISLPRT